MKKLPPFYLLFFCLFIWYANSNNPPNGRTGAPGDNTCISCHDGDGGGFEGEVSIQGLPDDILPSTTYNLTITTNFSNGSPSRAGFQMLILDGGDSNIGTFSNLGTETDTEIRNGREYLEHRPAKSFNGSNEVNWTADWTSPASATNKEIKVYINSIIGNGSGSSGDLMVSTQPTFSLMEEVVFPPITTEISNQTNVSCFNGTDGQATVIASGGDNNLSYQWSNGVGEAAASNLGTGTYQITITDGVGTTSTTSVIISQPSQLALTISNIMNRNCTSDNGSAMVQVSGGTRPYTFNWSDNSTAQAVSLSAGIHSVTVTDNNGCNSTEQVTISDERQFPIAMAGADITIDCSAGNTASTQLNAAGSSNGGTITYLWTTTNGNIISGENTIAPTVNASGTYLLNVQDTNNGCSSTDEINVIFAPMTNCSSGNISGKIIGADGDPISNVTVNINGQSILTSSDGSYSVSQIPFQTSPSIDPSKLDGITQLVSTFDLVLITKHILNSELLDSPLKLIAADVNASGSISSFDIVLIRKVILGIDNEFPDNTSWRFIPADFDLSTATTLTDLPSNITFNNFTTDQVNQDFIGIKIGDVSFTSSNGLVSKNIRRKQARPLALEITTTDFIGGSIIDVPISFTNLKDFSGFQVELAFDPDILEFQRLSAKDFPLLTTENVSYNYTKAGRILLSWVAPSSFEQKESSSRISLNFKAKKAGNTSDVLWIDDKYLSREAYTKDLQIADISFTIKPSSNKLLQRFYVFPNPTTGSLSIGLDKKYPSIEELSFYTIFGEKVKTIQHPKIENNTIKLVLTEIPAGTYFVTIGSDKGLVAKKVIVQ